MVDIPTTISVDTGDGVLQVNSLTGAVQGFQSASASASDTSATDYLRIGSSVSHLGVSALVVADRMAIAGDAVQNAQIRQEMAQQRLTDAVTKYGAGNQQAIKAQQELEIATNGLTFANERYWVRVAFAIGSVLPSFITGISRAVDSLKDLDLWNKITTLSTDELTTAQLALMAATGVGLVAAVAIAASVASGALNVTTPSSTSSVSVYGDVNMQSPTSPGGFGSAATSWAQSTRG